MLNPLRYLCRYVATLGLAAAFLAAVVVLMAGPAKAIATAGHGEETATELLELGQLSERSVVYDRDGNILAVLHVEENRSQTTLDQIPKHVIDAVLDVEDDQFYEHGGINLRSIVRAAVANAEAGDVRQGGSTITQQLVKQSLLTPERDIGRKVKEAVLAMRLEDQMTKDQILERYLNTVYLGNEAYGIEAAAETYWGVRANELSIEQGALLAGLIRNPVGYDPLKRPEVAVVRRSLALDRMVTMGHLDEATATALKAVPLPSARSDVFSSRDSDFYFVEEVKQRLLDDARLGGTYQERYNTLFRGGLRIDTTYDPRLQKLAEDKVAEGIPDTDGRFSAALVSVEPATGAIRAMVAGRGRESSQFNLATGRGGSGRQPGSSFKPIVLLAALENGIGPNDIISGTEPCPITMPGAKETYLPGNYEGSRGSRGTVANATVRSYNCAYARLGLALDPDPYKSLAKVVEMGERLGIPNDGDYGPSISLGAEEVTPLLMASAYATIANDGVRHEPYFVERVTDRAGNEVFHGQDEGKKVVEPNVARAAISVMRKVVESGTGTKARLRDRDVAGKTGTSQEWRDAWFIGFTPQLSTAIWMGNPLKQDSMTSVGGIRVTGGSYPAATWAAFMKEALAGQPALKFAEPDLGVFGRPETIRLSRESGGSGPPTTVRRSTTQTTARPAPQVTAPRATVPPTTAPEASPSSGAGADSAPKAAE